MANKDEKNDFFEEFEKGRKNREPELNNEEKQLEEIQNEFVEIKKKYKDIGDLLKETREKKNLTIEEVSSETYITTKYLIYIEQGKFDKFPAETYLIGFLRKYSGFLGFVPEDIIAMYYGARDDLEKDKTEKNKDKSNSINIRTVKVVLITLAGVLVIALIGFLIYGFFHYKTIGPAPEAAQVIEDAVVNGVFYKGDTIPITSKENKTYEFKINYVSDESVEFDFEGKKYLLIEDVNLNVVSADEKSIFVNFYGIERDSQNYGASLNINFKKPEIKEAEKNYELLGTVQSPKIALEVIVQENTFLKYVTDEKESELKYYNEYSRFFIEAENSILIKTSNPENTAIFYKEKKLNLEKGFLAFREVKVSEENGIYSVYTRSL